MVTTKYQSAFQKKTYLPNVEYDVTTSKNNVFVTFVPEVHIQKQFSKNIFMSIRPLHIQAKVQF